MTDLTLAMKLLLESQRFVNGLTGAGRGVKRFSDGARNELSRVRAAWGSVEGKLATVGAGIGAVATIMRSAQLDKKLTQIQLTAGAGATKMEMLRKRLHQLAQESGKSFEDLMGGFNSLIQSGQSFDQATATIEGLNQAMAVTNVDAVTLSGALTVAATAFDFDLSKPGMAVDLLEKMTVAGRAGNAELEDLSGVFSRVGVNAKAAGLGFTQTLSFIEALSAIEKQPERLATLGDSTLRIFTNDKYRKAAQKATGIKFYDGKGERRDAMAVMSDIEAKYQSLKTTQEKDALISKAFGETDQDTIKGLRTLLSGGTLSKIGSINKQIEQAAGTFARELPKALNNAPAQVERLKAALFSVADGFSVRFNAGITAGIKKLLDSKEQGGMGLSGGQLLAGGAAIAGGTYLAARLGGPLAKKLLGKAAGLGEGVATGKALEQVGVQPVYVVNMPGSGMGGGDVLSTGGAVATGAAVPKAISSLRLLMAAPLSMLARMGPAVIARATGMVGLAGAAGYGAGSLINKGIEGTAFADSLGRALTQAMAALGSSDARDALAMRDKFDGNLTISVEDNRISVKKLSSNRPELNMETNMARGMMMVMP